MVGARFYAPTAGYYAFYANVRFDLAGANPNFYKLWIAKNSVLGTNGMTAISGGFPNNCTARGLCCLRLMMCADCTFNAGGVMAMNASDYASVWITEGPSAFTVQSSSGFSGVMIPSVTQGFAASNNYAQLLSTTNNELFGTFAKPVWDTTLGNTLWSVGGGLGSNGRYTVQESGYYLTTALVRIDSASYVVGQTFQLIVAVNQTLDYQNFPQCITSSIATNCLRALLTRSLQLLMSIADDTLKVGGFMRLEAGWTVSVFVINNAQGGTAQLGSGWSVVRIPESDRMRSYGFSAALAQANTFGSPGWNRIGLWRTFQNTNANPNTFDAAPMAVAVMLILGAQAVQSGQRLQPDDGPLCCEQDRHLRRVCQSAVRRVRRAVLLAGREHQRQCWGPDEWAAVDQRRLCGHLGCAECRRVH